MSFSFHRSLATLTFAGLSWASCALHPANAATSHLSFDFNAAPTWKDAKPYASSSALGAKAVWQPVGSYNIKDSATQSGGWRLSVDASKSKKWSAGLSSGLLPFSNTETNLGKLTLSFTVSASAARPVKVKIASFGAKGQRTGGLETLIYPAAPNFLQRYSLDLNTCKPSGAGKFDPKAPQVQFAFDIDNGSWAAAKNEICVDDVNFSGPAFYVSPGGSDTNSGRSETAPFATVQKAIDVAQAGDIILLMKGTYATGDKAVAQFQRAGTPANWIVLKNYPGQTPTLTCHAWNTISISKGWSEEYDTGPGLAYVEVRGIHIRGEGDVAATKYAEFLGKPDPRTNTNGIAIDGRYMKNIPHHIRLADNLVEYCPSGGMGPIEADWVTMENNIVRYNSWTSMYGSSGMGTMGASNFDKAENIYKMLIRNNTVYRNETYQKWAEVNRISDGNGIIIDINQRTSTFPNGSYIGRTLVQNNLCFDNGGSGIHTVQANRVDIIGNTTYMNSASKALQYPQIFTWGSEDVRIFNNILVAPVADVAAGEKPEPVNKISGPNKDVVFKNNIYMGGNIPPDLGEGDRIDDPNLMRPTVDPKVANFRLTFGSPASGTALVVPFAPYLNLDGQPRGKEPNIGAF